MLAGFSGTAEPYLEVDRDPSELVEVQRRQVSAEQGMHFFDEFPVAVMVFNHRRQIVFFNDKARALVPPEIGDPYGLRPGEAFGCVHADDGPGGCGTGAFCRFCGAARSIAGALNGALDAQECRLERSVQTRNEQLELMVWTKPFPVDGAAYILSAIVDISAESRRDTLERIFLHDIMNTAASFSSLVQLIEPCGNATDEYLELAQASADQLTEEIASQRALRDAERGSLHLETQLLNLAELAAGLGATFKRIAETRSMSLKLNLAARLPISSDPVLLKRVLSNLLKNALEASREGDEISLSCDQVDGRAVVTIHNPAVMSEEVYANLFKRSFSTKGRGRGLGTYAARLFVEDFLGGTIRCDTAAVAGTNFIVTLPSASPGR